ncbi:MAG: hypothetical protein ACR2QS_00305, partial [Woeseiaceae bacterium]
MAADLFPESDGGINQLDLDAVVRISDLEAWATDPWVPPALLRVEQFPRLVIDPCCGLGAWSNELIRHEYSLETIDRVDWSQHFPDVFPPMHVRDFLTMMPTEFNWLRSADAFGQDFAVVMNPPFSGDDGLLSCKFVDKARSLGARKIACFQRLKWRESAKRAEWWAANPPARIWLCVDRATCWRFDIPDSCDNTCLLDKGEKVMRKTRKQHVGCRECM